MFFHKFREDFVLALELLLQQRDPPVLGVGGAPGAGLEGGGAVLKELVLPAVAHRGVDAVLVTQIRDGDVFEEMAPQDGDLLLGGESFASFLGQGRTSAGDCSLFERAVLPIPSEAGHVAIPTRRASFEAALCVFAPKNATRWQVSSSKQREFEHKVPTFLPRRDRQGIGSRRNLSVDLFTINSIARLFT
jgi:hypothetical protein